MDRAARARSRANYNLQMKSSSLYFLNDISNFNSTENLNSEVINWRDSYTFNPIILGRGHFSKVYKAKCLKTGKYVAVKVIRRRRLGLDKIDDIMKEIEMMQLFNKSSNSGFIQLLKYHVSNTEVAVLIEFAAGGSIYNVIQDSEHGLPEIYSRIILSKILSAIGIMHGYNIVHLDIKADNVLLRHPYPSTDVALADFGLARKLSKSKVHKEMIGTPDYIAPEVSNYDNISTKSDMWSMGVLTYFILTNISPFCADTKEETLNRVTKAQFEYRGSLEVETLSLARDFISNLLIKIPEKRFSAEQCLNHDFLSSVPFVEYPPSIQSAEKSVPSINVIEQDYQPQVRDNANYKVRALVISQYDIESSFDRSHIHNPRNSLLQPNSTICLSTIDRPFSSIGERINEERYKFSEINQLLKEDITKIPETVDDINSDSNEELEDDTKETIEIIQDDCASLDVNLNVNNEEKSNFEEDSQSDIFDQNKKVIESPEIIKQTSCYSSEKHNEISNTSLSEVTSSWNDTTNNIEGSSESESINQEFETAAVPEPFTNNINEKSKPNGQIYNARNINESNSSTNETYARAKIHNSRRHIKESAETCKLKRNSFRHSRENLVEIGQSMEDVNEDLTHSCIEDFSNSQEYNTIPFKKSKSKVKKRNLTRSLKRDCDKPGDTINRRSQIISKYDDLDTNSDYPIYISKSHSTIGVMRVDSPKEMRNSYKLSDLFKSKRRKHEKKICTVS